MVSHLIYNGGGGLTCGESVDKEGKKEGFDDTQQIKWL